MRYRLLVLLLTLALALSMGVLVGCSGSEKATSDGAAQTEDSPTPSEVQPKGAALVSEKCSRCHSIGLVESANKDATQWQTTIERMQTNGLQLTDSERQAVIDYLAERDSRR